MVTDLKQQDFLVANFDLFVERLCYSYPFDIDLLRKYKDVLRWDLLSFNENVKWTEDLILEFRDYLDFGNGDEEAETKWINLNKSIPWSVSLLRELEDRVQWSELATHDSIRENETIKYTFYHRLEPFWNDETGDFIDDEGEDEDLEWLLGSIENYDAFPELCYHRVDEIGDPHKVNWEALSQNIYLPWSIKLIDLYEEHWDWEMLSCNESLPWSAALIERYRDRWCWGGLDMPNEQGDRMVRWGITSNQGIRWDRQMMLEYRDEHDWFHLSSMSQVDWNADTILEFEMYLNFDQILFNEAFWFGLLEGEVRRDMVEHLFCLYLLESQICLN